MWKNARQDGHEKHQENNLKDGFLVSMKRDKPVASPSLLSCQLSPTIDSFLTTEQCHKIFTMKSPL